MQKIILVLASFALIPAVYVAVAYAEVDGDGEFYEYEGEVYEGRMVAKRMTCSDIKNEMDRLSSFVELSEAETVQLGNLRSEYRSKCNKSAGRRSIGRTKVIEVKTTQVVQENTAEATEVESQEKAKSDVAEVKSVCDKPDENGCCPGETYKDLGDLGFNCCTENDEHCFPPMEKKLCEDGKVPDDNGCCAGETYKDLGDLGFNCCTENDEHCFPPIK